MVESKNDTEWRVQVSGVFQTDKNNVRVGGAAELGHCDRQAPVCVDKGFGVQLGVGSAHQPVINLKREPLLKDYDFFGFSYFGRLGLLFNPSTAVGLGPMLRVGLAHNLGHEQSIASTGTITDRGMNNTGFFFNAGLHLLLTGRLFGASLEAGLSTQPSLPGAAHPAGFYAQAGGVIHF